MNPATPPQIDLDDLMGFESQLSDEEKLVRATVRRFVAERYLPRAGALFESGAFPHDLIPEIAELGLLGAPFTGWGCAEMGAVAYGLAVQELDYGDSGLRSFVSVQNGLCMYPIWRFGSDAQRDRWLPRMAAGEVIGCFGLTEPDSGSDPGALRTRAVRDGDHFVLHGSKMWITNSPLAQLAVVWAKLEGDDARSIRGFLVEADTPGYAAPPIRHKMSLRASDTGEIVLDHCRVPADNLLPGTRGLGSALACLNQARFGIAFGAVGAARACFDTALRYARERLQFGVPIARKQLVQEKLVEMAQAIVGAQVLVMHYARLKEHAGGGAGISPWQVSLVKRNNVAMALAVARSARAVLGAAGITTEYPVIRHLLNLESVYTYEGTHDVHTLILGRGLTGEDAF